MTAFANFHVRGRPALHELADKLRPLGHLPSFVSQNDSWTSLFPQAAERGGAARGEETTRQLSLELGVPALGFFVTGVNFRYWLCDRGAVSDAYTSIAPRDGGDAKKLASFGRPDVTPDMVSSLLRHKKTRFQRDTESFLAEWHTHRRELRDHLLKTYEGDVEAFMRQYDDQTAHMTGAGAPDDPQELASELGDLLGLPDGLARLGFKGVADGHGPLGVTARLE